jgi:hypothetical protein
MESITFGSIIITAALRYQFAPPTDGDVVLLIITASPYEPAVKTFFTANLLYDTAVR